MTDPKSDFLAAVGRMASGNTSRESRWTKRAISHDEARETAQRLINSHFHKEPHARITIPTRIDHDDDCIIYAYIEQQEAAQSSEVARLREALRFCHAWIGGLPTTPSFEDKRAAQAAIEAALDTVDNT